MPAAGISGSTEPRLLPDSPSGRCSCQSGLHLAQSLPGAQQCPQEHKKTKRKKNLEERFFPGNKPAPPFHSIFTFLIYRQSGASSNGPNFKPCYPKLISTLIKIRLKPKAATSDSDSDSVSEQIRSVQCNNDADLGSVSQTVPTHLYRLLGEHDPKALKTQFRHCLVPALSPTFITEKKGGNDNDDECTGEENDSTKKMVL